MTQKESETIGKTEILTEAVIELLSKGSLEYYKDMFCGEDDNKALELIQKHESVIQQIAQDSEKQIRKRVKEL